MELEDQWWKGQLAADMYQELRYKVSAAQIECLLLSVNNLVPCFNFLLPFHAV